MKLIWENINNNKRNVMKPTLYMTIGISGSGKSTYLNKKFDKANIISPDEIRKRLTGNVSDQSRNKEVFEITFNEMIQCIKDTEYAVLDSTNVSTIVRKNTIEKAKAEIPNLKTVGLFFRANPEVSKKRIKKDIEANKDRSNVPPEVIDRQYQQLLDGYVDIKTQFDVVQSINESRLSLSNILSSINFNKYKQ